MHVTRDLIKAPLPFLNNDCRRSSHINVIPYIKIMFDATIVTEIRHIITENLISPCIHIPPKYYNKIDIYP